MPLFFQMFKLQRWLLGRLQLMPILETLVQYGMAYEEVSRNLWH